MTNITSGATCFWISAALVAGQLLDNAPLAACLLEATTPTVDRVNTLMAGVLDAEA